MSEATKRQQELRSLMRAHNLTYADTAELASVSKRTIECWLARPGTVDHRAISRTALDLIKLRLHRYVELQIEPSSSRRSAGSK